MLRLRRCGYLFGIAAVLGIATPAVAQTSVGWDLGLYSKYVWRGLSLTNKPVLQPDLWVSVPVGSVALTVGGWANIEPVKYNKTNDISEGGGAAGPDLTEFDWWADLSKTFGLATVTVGATGYVYPNDFGLTKTSNTIEIYGKLGIDFPVLSPQINAYYDVDKVKGLYLEGSVSHSIPLSPAFSLTLGALAGYSAGQGYNVNDPSANFAKNDLTHVDLSASTDLTLGPLSVTPQFHFVINNDLATKFKAPNNTNAGTNIWFGASVSWSKDLGASK